MPSMAECRRRKLGKFLTNFKLYHNLVLEIGVHHGEHSVSFYKVFQNAMIYAFELDPRAIAKFKANIRNSLICLFETTIEVTDGKTKFRVSSSWSPNINPADAVLLCRKHNKNDSNK